MPSNPLVSHVRFANGLSLARRRKVTHFELVFSRDGQAKINSLSAFIGLFLLMGGLFVTRSAVAGNVPSDLGGPILPPNGLQLISTGGEVTVEIIPIHGSYHNDLRLNGQFVASNYASDPNNGTPNYTVNLGTFEAGQLLDFSIYVHETGHTWYMGPGSRNVDGDIHATVTFRADGSAVVFFEDLNSLTGSDRNFHDTIFIFRGVAPVPPAEQITYESACEDVLEYVAHQGIANSLCVKLDAAARAAARGNDEAAAGALGAFVHEVKAQTGKHISPEHAAILIHSADKLLSEL